MPNTPLLDKIKNPQDLKKLQVSELKTLAKELREELVDAVSVTGGHLGAGLGVVELTIAIHYLFDTPKDRLVWDVGHQASPLCCEPFFVKAYSRRMSRWRPLSFRLWQCTLPDMVSPSSSASGSVVASTHQHPPATFAF